MEVLTEPLSLTSLLSKGTTNAAVILPACHRNLCSRSTPGELWWLTGFSLLELQQPKATPWHTQGVGRGSSTLSATLVRCCATCWCRWSRAPTLCARRSDPLLCMCHPSKGTGYWGFAHMWCVLCWWPALRFLWGIREWKQKGRGAELNLPVIYETRGPQNTDLMNKKYACCLSSCLSHSRKVSKGLLKCIFILTSKNTHLWILV